jgi:hypothetical protein
MRNHRLIRYLPTGAVVAAAIALPSAAQARVNVNPVNASPLNASYVSNESLGGDQGSGFQWEDAGIGAAGAALLLGIGTAAVGTSRRRRTRTVIG